MAIRSQATITRPANITAYTALDVVGGAFELPGLTLGSNQDLQVVSSCLRIDVAAIPAGMTTFRLHLYSATPPSAIADNAAFDLTSADRAVYLGYVDLGTALDLGATLFCQADNINKSVRLTTGGMFGYLVTTGGFTPAGNSEVYSVALHAKEA
jgi:hypothetical protein